MAVDSESAHVRSNEVFSEVSIHLDHDGSRKPGTRHDQVIPFCARFNAAQQKADVPKFLPRDSLQ